MLIDVDQTLLFSSRKFEELSKVMHEYNNWSMYRKEISKKSCRRTAPFCPFPGQITAPFCPFPGQITAPFCPFPGHLPHHHCLCPDCVGRRQGRLSKDHLDVVRKVSTESMYETYHLLEAITTREKLDKLRRGSVTLSPGVERERIGLWVWSRCGMQRWHTYL